MSEPIAMPLETDWSDLPIMYAKRRERRVEERDSQQIGSLTSKIANSALALAATHTPSPPDSAISGTASPGRAVSRPIGQLPGVIGAAELLTAEQAWQARDSDSLESALYRSLKPVQTCLRPLSDDSHDLVGYELVSPLPPASLPMLRDIARRINEPAGPNEAIGMITRLLTVTKSREADGIDLRHMIAILAEELAEFPIDVLATVCRKWARQEKWWPSLSELRDQCQRATRWRRSLKKAIAA